MEVAVKPELKKDGEEATNGQCALGDESKGMCEEDGVKKNISDKSSSDANITSSSCPGESVKMDGVETTNSQCTLEDESKKMADSGKDEGTKKNINENSSNEANITSSCPGESVKMDGVETTNSQCTLGDESKGIAEEDGAKKNINGNGSNEANTTLSSSCSAESGKSECYVKYELPTKKAEDDWPSIDSSDFWAVEADNQNCDINNKVSVPSSTLGTTESGKSESADELALPKGDKDNAAIESAARVKDTEENSANNGVGVVNEKEQQKESTSEKKPANLKRKREEDESEKNSKSDDSPELTKEQKAERLAIKKEKQKIKRQKQKQNKNLRKKASKEFKGSNIPIDEAVKIIREREALSKSNIKEKEALSTSKKNTVCDTNIVEYKLTTRERKAYAQFRKFTGCDINIQEDRKIYAHFKIVKAIENILYNQTADVISKEDVNVFVPYLLEALQRNWELLKKYERERLILKKAQSAAKKTVLMKGRQISLSDAFDQVKKDTTVQLAYRKSMKDFKIFLAEQVLPKFNQNIEEFPEAPKKATLLKKNGSSGTRVITINRRHHLEESVSPGLIPPLSSLVRIEQVPRRASPWATDGMSYASAPQRAAVSPMPVKPINRFGNSPASNNRSSAQISPFVNSPSTSFQSTSPQQRNPTGTNRFQKVPPSPWTRPPSSLARNDSGQGKKEDFLISIIDKSSVSGVIPPHKEMYVKESLFAALDKAVAMAPPGSSQVPTFTSWQYKNGVIHLVCSDDYSLQWLVRKVVDIEPWPGATLGTRIDEEGRYRVTLDLTANPSKFEEVQVIMERMAAQNRRLNIMAWNVVRHICKGRPKCHSFVFDIPEEDIQELNRCGNFVNYGFQTFKVIQDMH